MPLKNVYVINDSITKEADGKVMMKALRKLLPRFELDAHKFIKDGEMRPQVEKAVGKAIRKKVDLVILDVYFGSAIGDPSERLGIDLALPRLVKEGIPVVILSALEDGDKIVRNILDAQKLGLVRYLTKRELDSHPESLGNLIDSLVATAPENRADREFGFYYREEDELNQLAQIQSTFDKLALKNGSAAIGLPLAAPVSNFVGEQSRPLTEDDSSKLFTSVTPDGRPMAVRYEGTMLVAKWVASLISREHPKKYSKRYHYFQEMVRVESEKSLDAAHCRAFYQGGFEAFSDVMGEHQKNILRVVEFAARFFHERGLKCQIRVSHLDIMRRLWERAKNKPNAFQARHIAGLMERKQMTPAHSPDDIRKELVSTPAINAASILGLSEREFPGRSVPILCIGRERNAVKPTGF